MEKKKKSLNESIAEIENQIVILNSKEFKHKSKKQIEIAEMVLKRLLKEKKKAPK